MHVVSFSTILTLKMKPQLLPSFHFCLRHAKSNLTYLYQILIHKSYEMYRSNRRFEHTKWFKIVKDPAKLIPQDLLLF